MPTVYILICEQDKTIFFGTSSNHFISGMVNKMIRKWNNPSLPDPHYIMKHVNHEKRVCGGFDLSYANQTIDYAGDNKYVFKPSNIEITFQTEFISYFGQRQPIERIYINGNNFNWVSEPIDIRGYLVSESFEILKKFLHDKAIKTMGRNLQSLRIIGENRQLPYNVEGVIAASLTGEHGHIPAHENALKQKLGYHLARRVRDAKPRTEGGKRTTRKNKRQI